MTFFLLLFRHKIVKIASFTFILFVEFFIIDAGAQVNKTGTLNILNLKFNSSDKLSFFGEAQLRSFGFYSQYNYHEFKGGVNYWLFPEIMVSLGLGKYDTYGDNGTFVMPKKNNEFRIWPQLIMQQNISLFRIEQRYRAEFRFSDSGYKNRFRYRIGTSYPFGKSKNGYKPIIMSISNEIFLAAKPPYFERNRILITTGYKFSKSLQLQFGLLRQFDYKLTSEFGKSFFVAGLYKELSHKKAKKHAGEIDMKDH